METGSLMDFLVNAGIMGVVEGITEFLPISSTGHLIIVNHFIEFKEPFASMFEVVIQLGAILSVIVYFHRRLNPMTGNAEKRDEVLTLWKKTIVGVVPAILIGGILGKKISEHLFNPAVVAGALIVGGIILIILEKLRKTERITDMAALSYRMALAIGLIQCLAMVPGTSRAAATIIGAMLLGASRKTAAEFSFFLAIPTMFAASAYSLMKHFTSLAPVEWQALAVGFAVSFAVALIAISMFMSYIRKNDFQAFGYYRIVLGILVIIFCVK
jgi:undecaprenyl-diphosphatase